MNQLLRTMTYLLTVFVSLNLAFSQVEQNALPLDKDYNECCNNHHGDYGAMKCAIDMSEEWNKETNKFYMALMNVLDSTEQNDLKLTQAQWLKYRDLEQVFSSGLYDMEGTMYSRMRSQRIMSITRRRALVLKSYYWIQTEEDESKDQDSKTTQSTPQTVNPDFVLPIPDSLFYGRLDVSKRNNAQYVIEKYIDTYLVITKAKEVIRQASLSHTEIPGENCLFKTEYNNIAFIEDYGCDSYFQTTCIEFSNYSFEEVEKLIKILLPKVYKRDENNPVDRTGWNESGRYYEYNSNCSLDIYKEENKTLVSYGCSC